MYKQNAVNFSPSLAFSGLIILLYINCLCVKANSSLETVLDKVWHKASRNAFMNMCTRCNNKQTKSLEAKKQMQTRKLSTFIP